MKRNVFAEILLALTLVLLPAAGSIAEETGNAPSASGNELKPSKPVVKELEGAAIVLTVDSRRNFGYRTGEEIPVTISVTVDPSIEIDQGALHDGKLTMGESDFELVGAPQFSMSFDGKRSHYFIKLKARSFAAKTTAALNVDLRLTRVSATGARSAFEVLRTPDFVIAFSRTLDNAERPLWPDANQVLEPSSPAGTLLVCAGSGVMLLLFLYLGFNYALIRLGMHQAAPDTPATAAWRIFDAIACEIALTGFGEVQATRLARALRAYLDCPASTTRQVCHRLSEDKAIASILHVLSVCDRLSYGQPGMLEAAHVKEMFAHLERIVPREQSGVQQHCKHAQINLETES
jgi:hypothetical protein